MTRRFPLILLAVAIFAHAGPALGQMPDPTQEFMTAKITGIAQDMGVGESGNVRGQMETFDLEITSGPEKGTHITLENSVVPGHDDTVFRAGETVVVLKQVKIDGSAEYILAQKYRLPALAWLLVFFVALGVLFGGRTGITSIAGLGVSICILLFFVIPRIVAGSDPLQVTMIGCAAIAVASLYLAHGFNKRTSIALLSTLLTLGIAALMAVIFVHMAKLFGMGSEESMFLQTGLLQNVNLQGLLLSGIIIGCLGVLDDVTTAQTAAIDEISKANPRLGMRELMKAGQSVGNEHIASLINTLALAYVGASLPLLLLLRNDQTPLWVTLNGEFLAEEIIRTLVGSATLLVAVPVSTWFAAYFLQGGRGGAGQWGHAHK